MSKHTKTPWLIGHRKNLVVAGKTSAIKRISVAHCLFTHSDAPNKTLPSPGECEANAELICAAVNSYAKLPDPLEAAKGDVLGKALLLLESIFEGMEDDFGMHQGRAVGEVSYKELREARALLATQEVKPCESSKPRILCANALTCSICGSPADRMDYGFQCQKEPGHMADLLTGIFSNLSFSATRDVKP